VARHGQKASETCVEYIESIENYWKHIEDIKKTTGNI
jgi:hypothetical protein